MRTKNGPSSGLQRRGEHDPLALRDHDSPRPLHGDGEELGSNTRMAARIGTTTSPSTTSNTPPSTGWAWSRFPSKIQSWYWAAFGSFVASPRMRM